MNKATLNTKKRIIILLAVDVILYLLFKHYQPLCEPCITGEYPPCLSAQQYNLFGNNYKYNLYTVCDCQIKKK